MSSHAVKPDLLVMTLTKYVLSRFPDSPRRTEIRRVSIMVQSDHESFIQGLPNCKKESNFCAVNTTAGTE